MKTVFTALLIALFAVATPSQASDVNNLTLKTLHAVAAVTADANGTALDLFDYEGQIAIIVNYGASGNVARTLDMKIQHADASGGAYTDVAGAAFVQTANAAGSQIIYVNSDEVKRFIRLNFDVTTPDTISVTVASNVVGLKKYR